MEKSLSSLKLDENHLLTDDHADYRCDECNGAFQKPLLATFSSHGNVQTYYACPRCLSKVEDIRHHESEGDKESSISMEKVKKIALEKDEDSARCKHFLGYLKKRSRDMPIPDECLTCDKMIACMVH